MAPPPLYQIRSLLDSLAPIIFPGNWASENRRGWRWVINLEIIDTIEACELVEDHQLIFGKRNVTIGHPFDEHTMKPLAIQGYCGLYVRDIEDLVENMQHQLDDSGAVEEWLGKK